MKIFNLLSKFKNTGQTSLIVFALFVIAGCSQSPQVTEQEDLTGGTGGRGELISIDVRETFDENLTEASLSLEEQIQNNVSFQLAAGVQLDSYEISIYGCDRGFNPTEVSSTSLKLVQDISDPNQEDYINPLAGAQFASRSTWTSGCKVDIPELTVNTQKFVKSNYDGADLSLALWDKGERIVLSAEDGSGKQIEVIAQDFLYDTDKFATDANILNQEGLGAIVIGNLGAGVTDSIFVDSTDKILLAIGESAQQTGVDTNIQVRDLAPTSSQLTAPAVEIKSDDHLFLTRSTILLNSVSKLAEPIVDCLDYSVAPSDPNNPGGDDHTPGNPQLNEGCVSDDDEIQALFAYDAYVRHDRADRGVLEISLECTEALVKDAESGEVTCDNQDLTDANAIVFAGVESLFSDDDGQIFTGTDLTSNGLVNINYDKMVRMIELAEADYAGDKTLKDAGQLLKVEIDAHHLVGVGFETDGQGGEVQVDQSPREKAIELVKADDLTGNDIEHSLDLESDICMLSERKLETGGFCMRFIGLAGELDPNAANPPAAYTDVNQQFNFGAGGYIMCTYRVEQTDQDDVNDDAPRTFSGTCQRLENFSESLYVNYEEPE